VEEHVRSGGFGSALLEFLNEKGLQKKVLCIALPDTFFEQGEREQILALHGLSPEGVAESVKRELLRCRAAAL
jgi:1-deoxy-D-xylulose-5-phosphate synthase